MLGLMQEWPLTVDKIFDHAKINHPNREIITRSVEGPIVTTNYGQCYDRAKKLSNWLLIVVLLEILMGVVMAYFNVPAFAQPIHLTLSIILVGLQFLIWLGYNPRMIWR